MKKLLATIILNLIAVSFVHAVLFTPIGPATFKLTAFTQGLNFSQVSSKTNQSSTSTNVTTVYKSTVTNSVFDSTDMLNLLANSFNTTFAPGSQVAIRNGTIY